MQYPNQKLKTIMSCVGIQVNMAAGAFQREYGAEKRLQVLLDMDGVLCDFEVAFLNTFRKKYPDEPYIEINDRRGLSIAKQYRETINPDMHVSIKSVLKILICMANST